MSHRPEPHRIDRASPAGDIAVERPHWGERVLEAIGATAVGTLVGATVVRMVDVAALFLDHVGRAELGWGEWLRSAAAVAALTLAALPFALPLGALAGSLLGTRGRSRVRAGWWTGFAVPILYLLLRGATQ